MGARDLLFMRPPVPDLAGRSVFVTGAAGGIGRALAVASSAAGARVAITDIDADGLRETERLITATGGTVLDATAGDITDHEWVDALAARIIDRHGVVDVVCNVAGVSAWGTVENLSHDTWRRMVEVNLMGPIHVIEAFVPPLVERGTGGHLVNVSSAAGLLALPWHAAYSASKFGIRGVSEVLRFDLRRHRIGVSLVVPGAVATPLVGTVDIAGIDRDHPSVRKAVGQFESRAVSPESAASSIIDGIRRNRYMVYTSVDIRIGYWFARKFALPYEVVMRIANDRFDRLATISRATSRRTG